MPTARSTWVKFSNRIDKLHRTLPANWKEITPKAAKVIVRSMEQEQPKFKGKFIIGPVYDTKLGYGLDIRSKPEAARSIMRKQFGHPGVSGRGPFPIYWESQEDRERVLQELLAEESQWIAGGKKGKDRHVSKTAEWKLILEGVIIRYGPFKGQEASRFIEKAVNKVLPKIRAMYSRIIIKAFKGL